MSKLDLLIESYNRGEMTQRELALQIKHMTMDMFIDAMERTSDLAEAASMFGRKVTLL